MRMLIRLLTMFLFLFILIACTSVPKTTETVKSTETAMQSKPITVQPIKQTATTTAVSPQPTNINLGTLSPVLRMNAKRATHTATLLPDGKVLIAGGFRQSGTSEIPIASAEIYDPQTNSFAQTGEMNEARAGHTATLLPNGLVLIVGGWGVNGRLSTTELYDPQAGEFRYAASKFAPRASMTTTLLQNGQLLIAGGDTVQNRPQLVAEIYDPVTNTFSQSGSLNSGRSAHTATLLPDGTVLLIGGKVRDNPTTASASAKIAYYPVHVLASAEIYHPTTGGFTDTGDMRIVRQKHAAVLLSDDDVLVIGGSDEHDWNGQYTSAEIYDTGTGKFTQIEEMNSERFKLADAAILLNNGNVLIGGGNRQIEIFDAQNRQFIVDAYIDNNYYYSVLTLLQDGRVLITGGYDSSIQPSDKAWIYND